MSLFLKDKLFDVGEVSEYSEQSDKFYELELLEYLRNNDSRLQKAQRPPIEAFSGEENGFTAVINLRS